MSVRDTNAVLLFGIYYKKQGRSARSNSSIARPELHYRVNSSGTQALRAGDRQNTVLQ